MAAGPAARLRIEPESNFGNSICGNLSARALKWWSICNSSATSDVIWHQSLLRNTCYTAKATFSFFGPDLCRLAHQFWVCQEYLRPICQRLTCHVTICSGSVNNWLNLSLCTGQQGKGCFAWPQRAYVKPWNLGVQKYKTIQKHTKTLWSLALSQTSVGNMLLSLDCLLADGMSFHLFF